VTANPTLSADSALSAALRRWSAAVARLGLNEPATVAGALLLAAELEEGAHEQLVGEGAGAIAPRRADLLGALDAEHGPEGSALGLAALEERGIVSPLGNYAGPWLKAELELDRRVRAYCLGLVRQPVLATPAPHPLPRVEAALAHLVARCLREANGVLIVLRGRAGSGRDLALLRIAGALQLSLLTKGPHELRSALDPFEPELSGAAAVWDPRRADPSADDYEIARRWLARSPTIAVALLDRHQDAPDVDDRIQLVIDVDPVDATERTHGWEAALRLLPEVPSAEIEYAAAALSRRSRAGSGLARRAALTIADEPLRNGAEVLAAAERALATLVRPSALRGILIEHPAVPLARLIAPPDTVEALHHIVLLARLAGEVEALGRVGVKALLSGPSGTGKTMAARAVATELALPLYRVDLASVVSKWVGETEKNLREALSAAEAAGAVLLFDEGDALFGKRGEVTRGADRYANMEVSYLLQAVEAYEGIAIVTTNVRANVDAAFERRFDACVELQPPNARERDGIWRQELGEAGTALPDAVFADIARRADLHGGSIAAAARTARVLARNDRRALVDERDVRGAVRMELLKSGSLVQAARWPIEER
jgi:hypothetical protein